MAIKGYVGVPGSGKTYTGLRNIYDEIITTKRSIVTNLAVLVPELAEYLAKYHDGETFDVGRRIIFINDAETKEFWKHRRNTLRYPDGSVDYVLSPFRHAEKIELPEGVTKIGGCAFHLDEIQLHFNARTWNEKGGDKGVACLEYTSVHRHLNDDLCWYTPSLHFVEKQFTRLTENFTSLRNSAKETWGFGPFKLRGKNQFNYSVTNDPPIGSNVLVLESDTYPLDTTGLSKCYNTAARDDIKGVGIADKAKKIRGMPFYMVYVAFGVVAVFLCIAIPMLSKGLGAGFKKLQNKAIGQTGGAPVVSAAEVASKPSVPPAGVPSLHPVSSPSLVPPVGASGVVDVEYSKRVVFGQTFNVPKRFKPSLQVVGASCLRGRWIVLLTDGTTVADRQDFGSESDRLRSHADVLSVDENFAVVRLDGEYYALPFRRSLWTSPTNFYMAGITSPWGSKTTEMPVKEDLLGENIKKKEKEMHLTK